jgi:hypothetical protein
MAIAGDDERLGHLEADRAAVAATRQREPSISGSAFLCVRAGHCQEHYGALGSRQDALMERASGDAADGGVPEVRGPYAG